MSINNIPKLVKHSDIQYVLCPIRIVKETVEVFHCDGASILDIIQEIDSMRIPDMPDQLLIHRNPGGKVMKVEWRTFQKLT